MATEDSISKWLAGEGCALLYASSQNSPNAPVYFVAVHEERKQLIVALRGTMSVSDAVTDMIGAPRPACPPHTPPSPPPPLHRSIEDTPYDQGVHLIHLTR